MSASEEKIFPPSDTKLERLRKEGEIPVSQALTSFAIIIGVSLSVVVLLGFSGEITEVVKQMFSETQTTGEGAEQSFLRARGMLYKLFFFPLTVVLLPVVGVGLYQTKFLITFRRVHVNFGRIFSLGSNLFGGGWWRLQIGFGTLVVGCLWGVLFCLVVSFLLAEDGGVFSGFRENLGANSQEELDNFQEFFIKVVAFSALYCFFIGVLSRLAVVLRYNHQHRMSRSELEMESKESEVSSEIRLAQRQRQAAVESDSNRDSNGESNEV